MNKVKTHQDLPSVWSEREKLRDKGQFWTPTWVAEAMVSYVVKDADLIFDPATGRGAFFDAFLKLNKEGISYFGIDIDNDVLADEIYNNKSCVVEKRDFIKNPPNRKFMAIVANPPYIRHHRIDGGTKLFLKKLSAKITGSTIDGRAGYHIYFLIQALSVLENNGRLAFIVPADTCEGTFAEKLWKWISVKFCIEAVITFEEKATPFPGVDTNAIILLIKNSMPTQELLWIKSKQAYSTDLLKFVSSGFKKRKFDSLEISDRKLEEAITTGLTRPEQSSHGFKYHLNDFARVMRGIATGSNKFFFLTDLQVKEFRIPNNFIKRAVGRMKDVKGDIITDEDIQLLENKGRPTYLLSINSHIALPKSVSDYLDEGEKMGLPDQALIKTRKPWYKMEKRVVPPILFAYLGRRNIRFILNEAGVLPLTGFLCVYPMHADKFHVQNLWGALNHPDTLANLHLVGKSYGSGAIKVEPKNLSRLPIPEHIVEEFNLEPSHRNATAQLGIF